MYVFSKPIAKCLIPLVPYVCYVIANLKCRDFDLIYYVANQFITFIWEYQTGYQYQSANTVAHKAIQNIAEWKMIKKQTEKSGLRTQGSIRPPPYFENIVGTYIKHDY